MIRLKNIDILTQTHNYATKITTLLRLKPTEVLNYVMMDDYQIVL